MVVHARAERAADTQQGRAVQGLFESSTSVTDVTAVMEGTLVFSAVDTEVASTAVVGVCVAAAVPS
ncbi:MAG: hypothetical protein NTU93_05625 [Arthrobacter sp.]|nr:hypothetical protein [Arthrobacter sp.]